MLPLTDDDLKAIRAKHIRERLFANRFAPEGTFVAVRRNLNFWARAADGEKYSLQTIHKGAFPSGGVLGYDYAATLRGVTFVVDQQARAEIAAGRRHKFPMAGVNGWLSHKAPSLMGVHVRFNPKTSHLFTRVDNGLAVREAEEVTIFHTRVYVRGHLTYWNADDAPQPLENIPSDALYE